MKSILPVDNSPTICYVSMRVILIEVNSVKEVTLNSILSLDMNVESICPPIESVVTI